MKKLIFILLVLCLPKWLVAQMRKVDFEKGKWQFVNADVEMVKFKGKDAMHLKKGLAYLKDFELKDGTVQVDMFFKEKRGFHFLLFRMMDENNREEFYVRPHQSGNPDANQYTPVLNGKAAWQLYYGKKFANPVKYDFDKWHTVKIAFAGKQALIYFDDLETPILQIDNLRTGIESGTLGLDSFLSDVYYANFQYSDETPDMPSPKEVAPLEKNIIQQWQVSNAFPEVKLEANKSLESYMENTLKWETAKVEEEGFVNLAKYASTVDENNTIVAALEIQADSEQVKKIEFGFSDEVKVYLNGTLLYEGKDLFRSRDYRYLGTVGFFDALYLPLKKGENKVWFVVKENMGGWGIQAKLGDLNGVKLVE